ncbi:bicyclomycin resistance protein [Ideonella sp. 4Y16]|uniref:Bicyclomycin resistance protein n=1 Tax=Ideonella alba TaxID=2824118 RepID=A0A940Y4E1_9BURK|nr:ABC transporter substrate-binding protein [Ideonella alba]MBQ0929557.1 bicyclomycin resistance protein [Ideonella alba]MBQ0944659.1 bicyclomycin resistance protein [Ideonella alba]
MRSRRELLQAGAALGLLPSATRAATAPTAERVLRYAFRVAETGMDPVRVNDIYSRTLTAHLFEGLYAYDHLARPAKFRPLTAAAMPEVADDFRRWTVRLRPGILFADDPAFGGRPRELVAEDYVYSIKRYADPQLKSPNWGYVDSYQLLGLAALRQRAQGGQAFDYDTPIEGLRALDRYTLQFRLAEPRPRFIEFLAVSDLMGALAREVVERYGERLPEHPVGTGPFVLQQWRRASRVVLVRNPQYRERVYDAEPAPDDAEGQALLARFKGRRLPMIDRVEVSIVEESQPRWLAFLNGQHNFIEQVPADFVEQALPGGRLAPYLAQQGVKAWRNLRADMSMVFFNLEDPVVGGYTPERVALRRAIGLGLDVGREIRVVHRGQARVAHAPIAPHTGAFDPALSTEMGQYDPARARALLDLYGWTDRNGDGWRERPDGSPLTLVWSIEDNQRARQLSELWLRDLKSLGLRVEFKIGKWPELLKAARAGSFQMWHVGSMSAAPDSQGALQRYDGSQVGGQNMARFKRPEFDAIYQRLSALPDGPERDALFREAVRLTVAWMPYKVRWHSYITDLAHAPVHGYRRPLFWQEWWHMVDVDPTPAGT